MIDLTIYEVGARDIDGKYSKFMESPDRQRVEEYSELMLDVVDECFEVVFYEKTYRLISTTPHIVTPPTSI